MAVILVAFCKLVGLLSNAAEELKGTGSHGTLGVGDHPDPLQGRSEGSDRDAGTVAAVVGAIEERACQRGVGQDPEDGVHKA